MEISIITQMGLKYLKSKRKCNCCLSYTKIQDIWLKAQQLKLANQNKIFDLNLINNSKKNNFEYNFSIVSIDKNNSVKLINDNNNIKPNVIVETKHDNKVKRTNKKNVALDDKADYLNEVQKIEFLSLKED